MLYRYADDFVSLEETGSRARPSRRYRKTYEFEGTFINSNHRYYAECPRNGATISLPIPGCPYVQTTH